MFILSFDTEFVMASPNVLDEGMTPDHNRRSDLFAARALVSASP